LTTWPSTFSGAFTLPCASQPGSLCPTAGPAQSMTAPASLAAAHGQRAYSPLLLGKVVDCPGLVPAPTAAPVSVLPLFRLPRL
jgi:hypothetical protein